MVTVNVRSLSGKRAEVECSVQQTVRQLKGELALVDAAFAACKLYLRVGPLMTQHRSPHGHYLSPMP